MTFLLVTMHVLVALPATVRTDQRPQSATVADDRDLIDADRPGIADSSRVIAQGRLQIESGFQRDFHQESGTETRTSAVPTLVRVGLGAGFEARMESNMYAWLVVSDPGSYQVSGWSPASLGFKYQMYRSRTALERSLGTIVRVFPASGSHEFGTSRVTGDVRATADLDLSGSLSVNPNAGIARYEGAGGRTFVATLLAVTVGYAPSRCVSPFLDVAYQRPVDVGGGASLILDGGLGYLVGQRAQLDFSLGYGVHGRAPRPFVAFGFSVRSDR